jgi:hypothetical protein
MMLTERRRHPRAQPPDVQRIRLDLKHRVQLLDISQSGALLGCDVPLPAGTCGLLRTLLTSGSLVAEFEIRREHPGVVVAGQSRVGAMFVAMDEASRRSLNQFLRRASEEA